MILHVFKAILALGMKIIPKVMIILSVNATASHMAFDLKSYCPVSGLSFITDRMCGC